MKFDFHIHSNFSDGTDDAKTILDKVILKSINVFSITDHDDIRALLEVKKYADILTARGISYLAGVEFSCVYEGRELHILGYGMDVTNKQFLEFIQKGKKQRRAKRDEKVKEMRGKFGILLTADEEKILYSDDRMVGSIDFAKILIARGFKGSVDYFVSQIKLITGTRFELDAEEAILAITASGGIAALAHPRLIMRDEDFSFEKLDKLTAKLMDIGLGGIEAYHSSHSRDDIILFRALAEKRGLLICGGSDYHGKNKPNIKIGNAGGVILSLSSCPDVTDFIEIVYKRNLL